MEVRIESSTAGAFERASYSKTKIRLYGGKGGVGKTTAAAATAFHLSQHNNKVMVISSDPAPSLSDIFGINVRGSIVEVKEMLYATELDATKAMKYLKAKYGVPMINAVSRIVPVEEEVLDDFPNTVMPGLDELFSMETILELLGRNEYDYLIWDTAPTGHTLRILVLPENIKEYASGGIKVYSRLSGVVSTMKGWFGKDRDDSADEISDKLGELKEIGESVRKLLADNERVEFNLVIIPEALALYQSENLRKSLQEQGISINRIIVNNVLPEREHCEFCRQRRRMQQPYIDRIKQRYGESMEVVEMPQFPEEVKDLDTISRYAGLLYQGEKV